MNFTFGIPKSLTTPPVFSWRPFILLGIVVCSALALRAYQWIQRPEIPSADVPSISWEDVQTNIPQEVPKDNVAENLPEGVPEQLPEESPKDDVLPASTLPDAINLAVPFVSQAPFGIWDAFTEETCEEASLFMVQEYYKKVPEGTLDAARAEAVFREMVAVQDTLNYGVSISAEQLVHFAETYDKTSVQVVENPSVEDLRTYLAQGHPIIVPAFGRLLGNPFFSGEGPLYHMLVLRGYTPTTFITNDPGTRHGENYQYSIEVLMRAIGDWDGDSPDGGSRVLVLTP